MSNPSSVTKPSQFRLGEEALADLDHIASHHGLRSRTDAIRLAARAMASSLPAKKNRRKSKPGD